MLNWKGKRPFQSTQYYPAQLKETYDEEMDDWRNKIYWGDNLQVMGHLLKTYRGKINLIYIDPPFDSKADYKKKIELRGKKVENDHTAFEEKQYTDIWTNDEYLQFMYERLILMKELLADDGSIYVHCDWRMNSYIRLILDEVFGKANFQREIIWDITVLSGYKSVAQNWIRGHESLFYYSKNSTNFIFNKQYTKHDEKYLSRFNKIDEDGRRYFDGRGRRRYLDEVIQKGKSVGDVWSDIMSFQQIPTAKERINYPTQKPEALLERIIKASSNPGDIVFDCFMGSGTTQAVAMKLGRRFIGADINLGAVETTTKRLLGLAAEIRENTDQGELDPEWPQPFYIGFEVYNVNDYDVFRNPVEAKALLIEALEIQPLLTGGIYDGEKDGRMVKIMPIDRIATRADLNDLIFGFDNKAFQRRQEEHPTRPVEKLLLVCMGHEPDLAAALQNEVAFDLDIEVTDILRDKSNLEFRRESAAEIVRSSGELVIERFYPMNLLQKLSLMKENVEDWRKLVESVKIDFNYDGAVMNPSVVDLSDGDTFVEGTYPIPTDAGTIRVKITDLLSESLEMIVE
ncbi:MAG: site-specific DNA-methyltransferase [Candidatus Poribacteria bacterium]|nr:site-specific DNA-methyltransferase [Candidatus Poribacteria bacterium]